MKFKPGDLVTLVDTGGNILDSFPPALVLSGGIGYAINPCIDVDEDPGEIYTILYGGAIDFKVSCEWLIELKAN